MYVVAFGNAFDGIVLIGPFNDHDTAVMYAENESSNEDWTIVKLVPSDTE